MARLVTKFKYLKPGRKKSAGGYAKYIATRDGVEMIDESKKYAPATKAQQKLIDKVIKDFPDTEDMLEYKDYLEKQTVEMASEFLSRVMEDKAYEIRGRKAYAGYIALRPRAERSGSHGLFTNDGEEVNLTRVMKELDNYNGNLWTAVISLRRADAERLGYNNGERWRTLLRSQTEALSKNMKIPMKNLRWYAAFHNESHHPHVHLIVYSADPKEGYLSRTGIEKLRSSIAGDIFKQDLLSVYEKQTNVRNTLKSRAKEYTEAHGNAEIEDLLVGLSNRLRNISGKKIYGYLPADVKNLVDEIVNCLSADKNISELYSLWYELKEQTIPY